jgi:2-haloacid dehalogenase
MPSEVLAFDVNETLLDLRALDPLFMEVFGDASLRPAWFQTMLQLSFVGGLTDRYVDFTTAQRAALSMLAERAGRHPSEAQVETVVDGMRRLPPHAEVRAALEKLRAAGYRQVTLTNSPLDVARDQLTFAGIIDLFDDVLSADEVKRLKPAPEPYRLVARRTGVAIGEVRLVAAHAWDVAGALAAGARAAFVARPGAMLSPIGQQPDVIGKDINEVVERLLAKG